MMLNEGLRKYLAGLRDKKQLYAFARQKGLCLQAISGFINGSRKSMILEHAEPAIKQMIIDKEFDVDEWLKNGR